MSAHIVDGTSAAYTLVHILHFLCTIVLHREYIPFTAINCRKSGPVGPIDERAKNLDKGTPPNFWKDSSNKCFKAAKDLTNLLLEFENRGGSVETALSVFALHQVAVCGALVLGILFCESLGH